MWDKLVHPALLQLTPYQPGKPISECQREYGITHFIKLASNENPLGASPYVTQNLVKSLEDIFRYPDGAAFALKTALSIHLKVSPTQLLLGNGSEDVLKMVLQAFAHSDQQIMIPQYAFIAYKILARGLGLAVKEIPVKNFEVDLDAMLAAITSATRVIILANPNNPTGTYIREEKLKQFLMALPKEVVLVLDEAYYEYVTAKDYPQSIALMEQHPNLVITRTFSKAYGLAGLRLGYGIAHPGLVELINRIRQPFNVNHIAQAAAIFALEDQAFVKQGVQINEQGKTQWYQALSRLGVPFVPSAGNFIMVHLPGKAHAMFQALLQKGIIVRPLDPYGLGDYLRISIGTEAENLAAIDALQKSLIEEKAHDRIT